MELKYHYSIVEAHRRYPIVLENGDIFEVTVGYRPLSDRDYEIAFAFCSPKDRFVKRKGREIVNDHFEQKRQLTVHVPPGESVHTVIDELLRSAKATHFLTGVFPDSWSKKYSSFFVNPRKSVYRGSWEMPDDL